MFSCLDKRIKQGYTVDMEKLLSVNDVAEMLGLHPQTVRDFAGDGKLPGIKVGKAWRFKPSEIEAYLERQRSSVYTPPGADG